MAAKKASRGTTSAELHELARLYGLEVDYLNVAGQRCEASAESLMQVLPMMGASIRRASDVPAALRERQQARWQQGVEPVTLAWEGETATCDLRLASSEAKGRVAGRLELEGGESQRLEWTLDTLPTVASAVVEGIAYEVKRLPLPSRMPTGYHRLVIERAGQILETLVVLAPRRAYAPVAGSPSSTWGVFLPLYALHSQHSWGGGDFADLGRLLDWTQSQGGGVVATLPLLAAFLDEPFECSPYSPASRLFWNEFYLDIDGCAELAHSREARAILESTDFQQERAALRQRPLVDYRRQMALKRRVLAELARTFFHGASDRRTAFDRYHASRPEAADYARFRAVGEKLRTAWPQWPTRLREGDLREGDYDDEAVRYHLYVQWLADEQIGRLASQARQGGPGLYLDLPLGVNGNGYDVWRQRDAFAAQASGGCPPDSVFVKGQNWGFPPLHPNGIRKQGYDYIRAYLRHQLKYAGVLRIDHMPVFHRLWWVPQGMEARDGVYVRYPAEELYAVFNLESHRHRTLLVGEDLGTVPPEVPQSMARHNVNRMYVVQYALNADPKEPLPAVPAGAVASINTHDMPPFAAFWNGADITQRQEPGLLGDQDPVKEQRQRRSMLEAMVRFLRKTGRLAGEDDVIDVLRASLTFLAESDARCILVNLEDLWQETESQNVPSTGAECPNWCRKVRYSLEEIAALPQVQQILQEIDRIVRARSRVVDAGST